MDTRKIFICCGIILIHVVLLVVNLLLMMHVWHIMIYPVHFLCPLRFGRFRTITKFLQIFVKPVSQHYASF